MTGSERQEKKTWMVSLISMILILGFFAISCLFLMNVGVQVYRRIVTANNDNFQLRTSLAYTATKVRQADKNGEATVRRIDDVEVLFLTEEYEGRLFETAIYPWEGHLYEYFMEKGNEFQPGYGFDTFEIADFRFEQEENQIKMTAVNKAGDRESMIVFLRSRSE